MKPSESSTVIVHQVQAGLKPLPGVKNIIAVASGKGGVGKSTVAVNMALALRDQGLSIGVLDADIYGPSQGLMLNAAEAKPETKDGKSLEPIERYGLQMISMANFVTDKTAMIWRGPMVSTAVQQLLNDTRWHDLDILVVDLPPGTGDIQLTMAQKIPVSGSIVVTTPQDIALLDAQKAIEMFRKVSIPVLGVVENMSVYVCPHCGHHEALFGDHGGERMAKAYDVPLLGKIPLHPAIREQTDHGKPTVEALPQSDEANAFKTVAIRMLEQLSLQPKDFQSKLPPVQVE